MSTNNYKYVTKQVKRRIVSTRANPPTKFTNPGTGSVTHTVAPCGHEVYRPQSSKLSPTGFITCPVCTAANKGSIRESLQQERHRLERQLRIVDRRLQEL